MSLTRSYFPSVSTQKVMEVRYIDKWLSDKLWLLSYSEGRSKDIFKDQVISSINSFLVWQEEELFSIQQQSELRFPSSNTQ